MSNLKLKPGIKFVPMGYPYTDPRTRRQFDAYQYGVDGVISMIIEHRRANPKHYPENEPQWFLPSSVRQEFLRHVKEVNPSLLVGGGSAPINPVPNNGVPSKCAACGGTAFSPTYCPTCGSGNRINGYKCDACGKVKYL